MRYDELDNKLKDYMVEVARIENLMKSKDKERLEMVENYKKLSEANTRLRGNNISMSAELCDSK